MAFALNKPTYSVISLLICPPVWYSCNEWIIVKTWGGIFPPIIFIVFDFALSNIPTFPNDLNWLCSEFNVIMIAKKASSYFLIALWTVIVCWRLMILLNGLQIISPIHTKSIDSLAPIVKLVINLSDNWIIQNNCLHTMTICSYSSAFLINR